VPPDQQRNSDAEGSPQTPPAGWYPDPTGSLRWWTGSVWTAEVFGPPIAKPAPSPDQSPVRRRDARRITSRRSKVGLIAVAGLVLALLTVGGFRVSQDRWPWATGTEYPLRGVVLLTPTAAIDSDDGCLTGYSAIERLDLLSGLIFDGRSMECPQGVGGAFRDLAEGASVLIADGSGATVASTPMTGGTFSGDGLAFTFEVSVPERDFYTVSTQSRSGPTYSRSELEAQDWFVTLTIG